MPAFAHPLTARIAAFLEGIGLEVRAADLTDPTFLPGVRLDHGGLFIDESRLRYPGDLLHEAGHLAVMTPSGARVATWMPPRIWARKSARSVGPTPP